VASSMYVLIITSLLSGHSSSPSISLYFLPTAFPPYVPRWRTNPNLKGLISCRCLWLKVSQARIMIRKGSVVILVRSSPFFGFSYSTVLKCRNSGSCCPFCLGFLYSDFLALRYESKQAVMGGNWTAYW
jgi:hypothetical protein